MPTVMNEIRKPHYLKKQATCETPGNLLWFDTESRWETDADRPHVERHFLRIWCAEAARLTTTGITREQSAAAENPQLFWEFLESRTTTEFPLWAFAHNLGFDLTMLGFWERLADGDYELVQYLGETRNRDGTTRPNRWSGLVVTEDPPTIIQCRIKGTKKSIYFVDSLNYFRFSMAEIGKSLGIEKLPLPGNDDDVSVWFNYCKNDVLILKNAILDLISLISDERLGTLAFTLGGQAMNCYKHAHLKNNKTILVHGNRKAIELERAAYYGGFAQQWFCGRVINGQSNVACVREHQSKSDTINSYVRVLDFQAFYPSVMIANFFPSRLLYVMNRPPLVQLMRRLETDCAIAEVYLCCSDPGFPVRRNGRTHYAKGSFWTVLCGPELLRAWRENAIRRIGAVAIYQGEYLFESYVSQLWSLRQRFFEEGNTIKEKYVKSLMNALHGKFGQHSASWTNFPDKACPSPYGHWFELRHGDPCVERWRSIGGLAQRKNEPGEHRDSCPAIAAYVCSYAREKLLVARTVAGFDQCLYSDTDSLHVLPKGYDRLLDGGWIAVNELGRLRTQKVSDVSFYHSPKWYELDGQETVAGISKSRVNLGNGHYLVKRFQGILDTISTGNLSCIEVCTTELKKADSWFPGSVKYDGWVELPWLNE